MKRKKRNRAKAMSLLQAFEGLTERGMRACERFFHTRQPVPDGIREVVDLPWGGIKLVYDDGQDVIMGYTSRGFMVCVPGNDVPFSPN